MNEDTLRYLIKRTASQSVSASALRNQGAKGVVEKARLFLSDIDIADLTSNKKKFPKKLDDLTDKLKQGLPRNSRHFGTARKSINIFLRDCLYNQHICHKYKLERLADIFEIPVDSHVANGLRKTSFKKDIPAWDAIIRLSKSNNDKYQKAANKVAIKLNCNRVDIDVYLWREIGIDKIESI